MGWAVGRMRTGVRTCIETGGMRPREEVEAGGSRGAMVGSDQSGLISQNQSKGRNLDEGIHTFATQRLVRRVLAPIQL